MVHTHYNLMAHDAKYYVHAIDEDLPLNFAEICAASTEADMATLDTESIKQHVKGMALVGTYWTPHLVQQTDVVSYAALTGFEDYQGEKLAVVGGIITLPEQRNNGFASTTVEGLLEAASTPEVVAEHGHQGFIARCNMASKMLMEKKHGFSEAGEELGKLVMVKMF